MFYQQPRHSPFETVMAWMVMLFLFGLFVEILTAELVRLMPYLILGGMPLLVIAYLARRDRYF